MTNTTRHLFRTGSALEGLIDVACGIEVKEETKATLNEAYVTCKRCKLTKLYKYLKRRNYIDAARRESNE